jgi:hypothetical protein
MSVTLFPYGRLGEHIPVTMNVRPVSPCPTATIFVPRTRETSSVLLRKAMRLPTVMFSCPCRTPLDEPFVLIEHGHSVCDG